MSNHVDERTPEILWTPSPEDVENAELTSFMRWLSDKRGVAFGGDVDALWRWSVTELEEFWAAIWDYFDVQSEAPYVRVLDRRAMPGAKWFEGCRVNWAEHILRNATSEAPALVVVDENARTTDLTWADLRRGVASLASVLRGAGISRGDRVCGYLPNCPEALVALLATASLGAVWAVCSPDFGLPGVIDRFAQLEPKALVAVDGYQYGGRLHDRRPELAQLRTALPSVEQTIVVQRFTDGEGLDAGCLDWHAACSHDAELIFEHVPFDHPLWVLFSSGTTGVPKGIVHSHVGIILEQLKSTSLNLNLGRGDRYYIYSSTSWMVFNALVGTMICGVIPILYEGSPTYPDIRQNWRVAAAGQATLLGGGSAYYVACQNAGVRPADEFNLEHLKTVLATGSVLPATTWRWIYSVLDPRVRLDSGSGGTDVCTGFMGGNALTPVRLGELTAPNLGVRAESWDDAGHPIIDRVGELVITEPMPSMPLFMWNDPDGQRLHDAYFAMYPGVWRHGDWVRVTERNSFVIEGRSDSTLNRGGIRMGSADIYAVVDSISGITDSLVLGVELPDGGYYMPLFVVLGEGRSLDDDLCEEIRSALRSRLSPRHVPDEILRAPAVPRTRTNKKLEVPIKNLFRGDGVDTALNLSSVDDPEAVEWFAEYARAWRAARAE
jgi:acetoacetyl-CoA synthetase